MTPHTVVPLTAAWVHPQIEQVLAWAFSESSVPFVERKDGDE